MDNSVGHHQYKMIVLCRQALKISCELTIGSYVSVHSSRYEARGKFGEHEKFVRVARGIASSFLSALKTTQVLHTRWMHKWPMNQLFYNISNPMEIFFSPGICLLTSWACTIGIWSTLVQLNLIRQIYQLCYKISWTCHCRSWMSDSILPH